MKRYLVILALLCCAVLLAKPVQEGDDRALSLGSHKAGSFSLDVSNYGFCQDLFYPAGGGVKYLFKGAPWISAKKYRRDELGRQLYWLAVNPSADSTGTVAYGTPDWQPWMRPVVDTLTTVGYDGDRDVYELLPAYNPLVFANPEVEDFDYYNARDLVLKSILGNPAPRPFSYPDPLGNYCFSIPQGGTFNTPGFETNSAYFYDFCPFGTPGDRDLGVSRSQNIHVPLGVAVHRESYAWNLQGYDRLVILKNTIYNTSTVDSLFDLALAEYVDCDVYESSNQGTGAADDLSGYYKGQGYEFAYARDADGDDGVAPGWLAHKIIAPADNRCAWFWKVGDGPYDYDPLSFYYAPRLSANEKYLLATGRNPDYSKFAPLRPEAPNQHHFEQPDPKDTRFLNVVYGNQSGTGSGQPLHLAPGASLSYYSVYFMGSSLEDLKQQSLAIESFINGGMQIGNTAGLTCIPYLMPLIFNPDSFGLIWHSYTDPDHFEVKYKVYDDPASTWTSISLPGTTRGYTLGGLDPDIWYQIKVASIYNPGPNEVYLESETRLVSLSHPTAVEDEILPPPLTLKSWPNPFNPETSISFDLRDAGYAKLAIYNAKGQKVRVLLDQELPSGRQVRVWDGLDDRGRPCASGVYFARLSQGDHTQTRKMLLLK